jgi:hypothetical protein
MAASALLLVLLLLETITIPSQAAFWAARSCRSRNLSPSRSTNTCGMPKIQRRVLGSGSTSSQFDLAERILRGMHERADAKTKAWFTNYVKGSEWIGCKVPTVKATIQEIYQEKKSTKQKPEDDETILDNAVYLIQNPACDAKLAGMILLSEKLSISKLVSEESLDRFDTDVWKDPSVIANWSSADWFSNRVLSKIVFADNNPTLVQRVLDYARLPDASLWQRRCGVVSFLKYTKHRDKLPADFGSQLIEACNDSLLISPDERFTQTGIAWVLRYVLLEPAEKEEALAMIRRHGSLWTTEAKKSLAEKLGKNDPRRKQILELS